MTAMFAGDHIKIAIFRALQLGDLLCAIPAVRALRAANPDAEITLISLPWASELIKRFPRYFDRLVIFPGYPGLPEQPFDEAAFEVFRQKMLDERFDLLIQMQGNGTIVNEMLATLAAKNLAGYYNDESFAGGPLFMRYPNFGSEIHRHLRLMSHLGITSRGDHLEFPITAADQSSLAASGLSLPAGRYACIHPGSRGAYRQWPPKFFAALANYCLARKLQVVLTGTADERPIVSEVIRHIEGPVIDASGKTGLGAVSALIRDAAVLVSNCTGVSHIAAATKTPSVVISMDGEPERWGPLDKSLHKVIDWTTAPHFNLALDALSALLREKVVEI